MRIPITLSELFVIRSGARIFVQLLGVFAILFALWAATVLIDQSLESTNESEAIPSEESVSSLSFPDTVVLTHRDGRSLKAMLVVRPSSNKITIQRLSDHRTFIFHIDDLSEESANRIRRYPISSDASSHSLQAIINRLQSRSELPKEGFTFPHVCTLLNTKGNTLRVTLLEREDEAHIRFRRMSDRRIFTLPIHQLVESDQQLIRQFPIGSQNTYSLESAY